MAKERKSLTEAAGKAIKAAFSLDKFKENNKDADVWLLPELINCITQSLKSLLYGLVDIFF